jgi:SulP family sulfate permease
VSALAGVTAWMGIALLDWSAWHRLSKMALVDAAAFLATATLVLFVNAVAAVAVGCSFYVLNHLWKHWLPEALRFVSPVRRKVTV